MIVRTQKSTLGVEHPRLPNKKGTCLRKTRSLASYRNIMPPSRSTKIPVSPSLPFVRSNALIRGAKTGLTRTLTSMLEEGPPVQTSSALLPPIASDQPDVEMSDDTHPEVCSIYIFFHRFLSNIYTGNPSHDLPYSD